MIKLHGVIGDRPELVIISNRCTVIRRAVLKVFHNATHGVCFYYVKGNIKSRFMMSKALWDEFEHAFINAAKAYGHEKFKRQLEGLWNRENFLLLILLITLGKYCSNDFIIEKL